VSEGTAIDSLLVSACDAVPPWKLLMLGRLLDFSVQMAADLLAGCFRCHNGGYCVAPDVCACPPQWTGYDCRTPVCTIKADRSLILQLQTLDIKVIQEFENDPCMVRTSLFLLESGGCVLALFRDGLFGAFF
jgi:hypothetical protein